MKPIIGVFVFTLISPLRGAAPVGDFTPDAQDEAVIISRAQLAASAGVVGNARQIYGDLRPQHSAPFLFVGKCYHEWSVDWVVWIAGDDRQLEAGAFCPELPPERQWLGVFATNGTRQYIRLRDFHRRAEGILASPVPRDPAQALAHGIRRDTYIIAAGGDPGEHDFSGTDTALGTQGGKAASLSIEIIRYLQNARIKAGDDPKSKATLDASHGILMQVETAMKRHSRPEIDALEEGQVCAILANGQHFDYLEIVLSAKGDNVIVTHAPIRTAAHTVVLKKNPNPNDPFPSEDVRALFAASAAAFDANLEAESATHMVNDRELLFVARKQDNRIIHLARCNTDCDPPEPELRRVLECLRAIGKDLQQPMEN